MLGIYSKGWVTARGVKAAFIWGTVAVIINIVSRRIGLPAIEDTYVAVAAALLIISADQLILRMRKEDDN